MKKKIALGVCCVYAALSALPACALGAPGEAADRLREEITALYIMREEWRHANCPGN